MKEICLATTNPWKVAVARQAIEPYGIVVKPQSFDLIEPQHDDPQVIALVSAQEAYRQLRVPVIKCDSGLHIAAFGGFPGPYSNYVERTLGVPGLLQLCTVLEDRRATIYSVIAFCDGVSPPITFYSETPGALRREARGRHGFFFDFIFVPAGYEDTLAEFDDAERARFWRGAYEDFARWYAGESPGTYGRG